MTARRRVRGLLAPVVVVAATIYLLIDLIFLSIVRPFAAWLAGWPILARLRDWIASLGPYPTLVLFLVPLAILEPVKPVAFYLMGTGHLWGGVVLISVGEVIKLTLVERLFHMSRDKLMSIRFFAWGYNLLAGWLAILQALPAWQAVVRRVDVIKATTRRLVRRVRKRR